MGVEKCVILFKRFKSGFRIRGHLYSVNNNSYIVHNFHNNPFEVNKGRERGKGSGGGIEVDSGGKVR